MKIEILGLPLDLGADHRGVDMGPAAIRIAGLKQDLLKLEFDVLDRGDLPVDIPEILSIENPKLKYLPEIRKANVELADAVQDTLNRGVFPLVLGGDHAIAIGTMSGTAAYFKQKKQKCGLIWVDAHGDMNTEKSTPSGNIHGMPFAVLLGEGAPELTRIGGDFTKIEPENAVLVGVRDIDESEREHIKRSGITVFTMSEIDRRGIHDVMIEAIDRATNGTAGFHVSFDIDALDPVSAPGVGTPVEGGLTMREAHVIMEAVARSKHMVSLEMVEVNPILDIKNQTANIASQLILSALGKRILG
ncbi:MAG: arginase [Calditrichaeota bacterium]|nr:MAG: arginase [Calditrichota bacterium]